MSTREKKMLRSVLERQRDSVEAPESMSTPLRGGNVSNPRIRLIDKHAKLTQIPVYTLPPKKPAAGVSSTSRDRIAATRPEKWLPRIKPRQPCLTDRFIPQRRHQNFDASNYFLTRVPPRSEDSNQLDVFKQLVDLETTWRKKLMKRAMEECNLIPGVRNQRVLNIGKHEDVSREGRGGANRTVDDTENGLWKTKARKKPLLGLTDIVADVPTMRHNWRHGLLDWGATHFIATMVGTSILIFDSSSQFAFVRPERVLDEINTRTRALKWNNAGTKIVICTQNSDIVLLLLESRKLIWRQKCRCTIEKPEVACEVLCATWTHTDTEIVVGCTEGRISSYNAAVGTLIDTTFAHTNMILAVAFSPNDRYLVSTGLDKAVRVLTWPSLTPYLAIGYYEPVQALAWHPWEVGTMCVGGGFEDGSLSLWDIHRQTSLGYRKIPFLGMVKNMKWNKLSGELVVQWNYHNNGSVRAAVTVLGSLDRVVDVVSIERNVMDIVWNPESTKLALRIKNSIKVWNFFGNDTSNWYDAKEKKSGSLKRMGIVSAGRTKTFEAYRIR